MQETKISLEGAPAASNDASETPVILRSLLLSMKSCFDMVADTGESHEITPDEWLILDALRKHDGMTMSQLRQNTLSAGSSLTRAVDRMVSRSLVFREVGQADRRQVFVHISDLGRSYHDAMNGDLLILEQAIRDQFSNEDTAPHTFQALLEGIASLKH